jgi:hypothetical protein
MGTGAHGESAADLVAIANQLLVELYRVLVDPAQVLLGLDATDELEQRLVASVDLVATRLANGDIEERAAAADTIIATVGRHDDDSSSRGWWDTPLGRACRDASNAGTNHRAPVTRKH